MPPNPETLRRIVQTGIKIGAVVVVIVLAILMLTKCGGEAWRVDNQCSNLPNAAVLTTSQVGSWCSAVGNVEAALYEGVSQEPSTLMGLCSSGSLIAKPGDQIGTCKMDLQADGCTLPNSTEASHVVEHLEWSLLDSKPQAIGFAQVTSQDGTCANFYETVITQAQ